MTLSKCICTAYVKLSSMKVGKYVFIINIKFTYKSSVLNNVRK